MDCGCGQEKSKIHHRLGALALASATSIGKIEMLPAAHAVLPCVLEDNDNLSLKFVLLDSSRKQMLNIREGLTPGKIGNNTRKWTVPQNLNAGIYYI